MTIEIVQICDGCGNTRLLTVQDKAGLRDISAVASTDDWVRVRSTKDLCSDCVKGLLMTKPNERVYR